MVKGQGAAADDLGHWMDRLIKLVPSEIVAVYLAGKAYAIAWAGVWSIICLILVLVVRIWGTRSGSGQPQWPAVAVAAISFVIWVYAMGGQFAGAVLGDPGIASAAVLIWTVLVPVFYKGD
jgi:hypothetical protein